MHKQRIYSVKGNSLNEQDRLNLVTLLVKAGYAARIGREKSNPKSKSYVYFVEYWEVESDE